MTGYVELRRNRLPNRRPRRGIPDPPCSASPSGVGTFFCEARRNSQNDTQKEGVECPPTFDPWLPQRARGQPCSTPAYAFAHAALSAFVVKHGACQLRRARFVFEPRVALFGRMRQDAQQERSRRLRFFDRGRVSISQRQRQRAHRAIARFVAPDWRRGDAAAKMSPRMNANLIEARPHRVSFAPQAPV